MAATVKSRRKSVRKSTSAQRSSRGRTRTPRVPIESSLESSLGETAAKVVAGAASAVRAFFPRRGADGDTATALLERQHREVERSFATALGTDDAKVRQNAMNDIVRQLTTHTKIEETIFYPAVRALDTEKTTDMILEAFEEHHVVKVLLKELPKVDPKAESFKAKMTVLKELVAHHVEEEEHEMFPLAERQLGSELSRELAAAMEARAAHAS